MSQIPASQSCVCRWIFLARSCHSVLCTSMNTSRDQMQKTIIYAVESFARQWFILDIKCKKQSFMQFNLCVVSMAMDRTEWQFGALQDALFTRQSFLCWDAKCPPYIHHSLTCAQFGFDFHIDKPVNADSDASWENSFATQMMMLVCYEWCLLLDLVLC